MTSRLPIVALALVMAGCGPSAVPNSAQSEAASFASETPLARPTLAQAGLDILPIIEQAGGRGFDEALAPSFPDNYNASLQLYRRNRMFKGGSVTIDRTDAGELYMVQVREGFGDRCGAGNSLAPIADAVLSAIGKSALTPQDTAGAKDALRTGRDFELSRSGAIVRFVGGCVKAVVIKAVDP